MKRGQVCRRTVHALINLLSPLADKPATSHSKRQKTRSTSSHLSSPNKEDEGGSDIGVDGVPEDDERLTQYGRYEKEARSLTAAEKSRLSLTD